MASASSTSAKSLFADSRNRLADRVQVNLNNVSSIVRQIQRGSKSHEMLMHAASTFAHHEKYMENTENNLKKMPLILVHLGCQQEAIENSIANVRQLKNKMNDLQR